MAAEAINKVKEFLGTKEIERRLKQEIERQQKNETLSAAALEPEASDNLKVRSNCNTLKMRTGKPFGITKIGARIMSIINVGGQEVTRNLSKPSDQTLMHIVFMLTICTPSNGLAGESVFMDKNLRDSQLLQLMNYRRTKTGGLPGTKLEILS